MSAITDRIDELATTIEQGYRSLAAELAAREQFEMASSREAPRNDLNHVLQAWALFLGTTEGYLSGFGAVAQLLTPPGLDIDKPVAGEPDDLIGDDVAGFRLFTAQRAAANEALAG